LKVLTIFLNLTNILEAGLKDKFNTPEYIGFYKVLLRLVDEDQKKKITDPTEEDSFILEMKAFWLLYILSFKNAKAKDYLFEELKLRDFIERKAEKYIVICNNILDPNKKVGFQENKLSAIGKCIQRFFEFVYYLLIKDNEKILEFKKKSNSRFNILLGLIEKNRAAFLLPADQFDVFIWIQRIYKDSEKDLYD
jgi:hypothetical protein